MTTLTERIKNGSGEDRELDGYIAMHFDKIVPHFGGSIENWPNIGGHWAQAGDSAECHCITDKYFTEPAHYTSDLNAVFALVEREWPETIIELTGPRQDKTFAATIYAYGHHIPQIATDRCRALLLALLAAKDTRP